MNSKEISEALEDAVYSLLEGLDQEVGERTQEIKVTGDEMVFHYYGERNNKDTKRVETIEYDPREFFGGDSDD